MSPFHLSFPVNSLSEAKRFYVDVLGCKLGREHPGVWADFDLYSHQLSLHYCGDSSYRPIDYKSSVDGLSVPMPHFGVVLDVKEFDSLAARLKKNKVKFLVEPQVRFKGMPGEQRTMFFKDPSGNNLEFKGMRREKLFATTNKDDGKNATKETTMLKAKGKGGVDMCP